MTAAEIPWHFIRRNEANRYPRRIITLDCEAMIQETKSGERQTFRLAVASFDLINQADLQSAKTEWESFDDAESLWSWVEKHCKTKSRTVLVAHNLSYDLRISDGMRILQARGWELAFLALDSSRCCARFKRKGASLVMVDLNSWLPTTLAKVASCLGRRKRRLPKQSDPAEKWQRYCRNDVEITREAFLRILRYLESSDLGNFRMTGPAMAMGAYRHRFLPPIGLLAHREKPILDTERMAAWAGRCEVWQHGEIEGPLYEWDFRLAYLNIATTTSLPVRLRGEANEMSIANLRRLSKHRAILAECYVRTDQAVLPARLNGGVGWPVGEFNTVLWDNELLSAHASGAEITIGRAWVYMTFPALAEWAIWLRGLLASDGLPVDALERIMLKDWARSLIGRFGARWPQWEKVAKLPNSDLQLVPYVVHETGEEGAYLQNGHNWFEKTGMVDAPDAMPAIMGYIMAESRVRLLNAAMKAGLENIVYMDTDSLIVNADGNERLSAVNPGDIAGEFVCKAEYKRGLFLGPRQIKLDSELRIAGLPKSAIQRGPRSFEATVWEGMAEGIRRGHHGEVRIYRRAVRVRGIDKRRRHLAGGATVPYVSTEASQFTQTGDRGHLASVDR